MRCRDYALAWVTNPKPSGEHDATDKTFRSTWRYRDEEILNSTFFDSLEMVTEDFYEPSISEWLRINMLPCLFDEMIEAALT